MLVRIDDGNRLFRQALIASLALHVLLALFLPIWTTRVSPGLQPVEAVSFARLTHISLQKPAAGALPAALPDTSHRAATPAVARVIRELSIRRHQSTVPAHRRTGARGRVAAAPRAAHPQVAAVAAKAPAVPVAVQQASPAPSPAPLSSEGEHAAPGAGAQNRGGVLPFGASQDPVLDPAVRQRIARRIRIHVTLVVTVGEDGHTQQVRFFPPLDAQTEHDIQALLADASWDPAVCGGGVSCAGTATIKL